VTPVNTAPIASAESRYREVARRASIVALSRQPNGLASAAAAAADGLTARRWWNNYRTLSRISRPEITLYRTAPSVTSLAVPVKRCGRLKWNWCKTIIIIIIHEFHRDASLEQNFRAADMAMYMVAIPISMSKSVL